MARLSETRATLATPGAPRVGTIAKRSANNGLACKTASPLPKTLSTDAIAAVTHFLTEMAEEAGVGFMAWQGWRTSYDCMAREAGWPPLSDKVLAMAMQHAGCRRRIIDGRRRGRGRYVAYAMRDT